MKKINYLGLVGLGCGALLLSGCGGKAHTLTCEMNTDDQNQKVEIQFNSDETKAEKLFMEMTMTIADDITDEQVTQAKDAMKSGCEDAGYKDCKVSVSGKKLTYSFEAEPDVLGYDTSNNLEDTKKEAEADGYTCK